MDCGYLRFFLFFAGLWTTTAIPEGCSNPPLAVTYMGSLSVTCGSPIILEMTSEQPVVQWATADKNAFYTLVMGDPDAPSHSNPTLAWYRHWLVGNVMGSDLIEGSISGGDQLSDYVGPSPPSGSGYHRYFFYLFRQSGKIAFKSEPSSRAHFDPDKFASEYNLGEPIAANFFIAERSDYNLY